MEYKKIVTTMLLAVVFSSLCSCETRRSKRPNSVTALTSPSFQQMIDSQHLRSQYKYAVRELYARYCADTCHFYGQTAYGDTNVTYGMLDLRLVMLNIRTDTVNYYFQFFIDSLPCDGNICYANPVTGLSFLGSDSLSKWMINIEKDTRVFYSNDSRRTRIHEIDSSIIAYQTKYRSAIAPSFQKIIDFKRIR